LPIWRNFLMDKQLRVRNPGQIARACLAQKSGLAALCHEKAAENKQGMLLPRSFLHDIINGQTALGLKSLQALDTASQQHVEHQTDIAVTMPDAFAADFQERLQATA